MVRRYACVALPGIRVELAREKEEQQSGRRSPMAVIVARPGSTVKSERDVLGNTGLDFVSQEGRAFGVRAGHTVAAARAKCASLRVRVVAEGAVSSALARIAEAALAFGPTTAFSVRTDVVWVDVSGCAHLEGSENALGRALAARVQSLGHEARVAIADGPRIAAAVARFSKRSPLVVPHGKGSLAMRSLPIDALGLDPDTHLWLTELGLSTCGDLQRLPRRSLGVRLGARVLDVMKLLDGHDRQPLDAWRPPEVPEERLEFDWGVTTTEGLTFFLKRLCDRLAARLEGRGMAATRVELVLSLDRALCDGSSPGAHRPVLMLELPSPIARAADLLAVVRARLERCSLAAPVLAVTLRAEGIAPVTPRTIDLFVAEPKADRVLPRLVAELMAEVGADYVGTLSLVDTWSPDERTHLRPFGAAPLDVRHPLVTSAPEPSRLVPARRLSREALAQATPIAHLARIEASSWWSAGPWTRRDLSMAWFDGGLSWLEHVERAPCTQDVAGPNAGAQDDAGPNAGAQEDAVTSIRGWFD